MTPVLSRTDGRDRRHRDSVSCRQLIPPLGARVDGDRVCLSESCTGRATSDLGQPRHAGVLGVLLRGSPFKVADVVVELVSVLVVNVRHRWVGGRWQERERDNSVDTHPLMVSGAVERDAKVLLALCTNHPRFKNVTDIGTATATDTADTGIAGRFVEPFPPRHGTPIAVRVVETTKRGGGDGYRRSPISCTRFILMTAAATPLRALRGRMPAVPHRPRTVVRGVTTGDRAKQTLPTREWLVAERTRTAGESAVSLRPLSRTDSDVAAVHRTVLTTVAQRAPTAGTHHLNFTPNRGYA